MASDGGCHVYDHTQPRVQQYWRDNCLKMANAGMDGCGADFSSGGHNSSYPPYSGQTNNCVTKSMDLSIYLPVLD